MTDLPHHGGPVHATHTMPLSDDLSTLISPDSLLHYSSFSHSETRDEIIFEVFVREIEQYNHNPKPSTQHLGIFYKQFPQRSLTVTFSP